MKKEQKAQNTHVSQHNSNEMLAAVFVEGQRYMIDADFNNGGEVELIKVHGKHFCRVRCPETGGEWDTMLHRLSVLNGG